MRKSQLRRRARVAKTADSKFRSARFVVVTAALLSAGAVPAVAASVPVAPPAQPSHC